MIKNAYTILIICEGENTEPYYFQGIKDKILRGNVWTEDISINIRPDPKPSDDENRQPSKYKSMRKRRQVEGEEETIKGQPPLKYIQNGREALQSGVYDEVWAVFDHDNHPARQAAFTLAQETVAGKKVQIAFSSMAFETWILMHFEQCSTAFEKSECRLGRDILNCNSGVHPDDCYGTKCIGGYLRHENYLPYSTKERKSLFPLLENKLDTALINAAWLRHQVIDTDTPIYDLNPYTNVDELVARLLRIDNAITWCSLSKGIVTDNLAISCVVENDRIQIHFHNQHTQTTIILPDALYLVLPESQQKIGKRMILEPNGRNFAEIRMPTSRFYIVFTMGSKRIFLY